MAFTSMVVFEMVRVHAVRMRYRIGLFSNTRLLVAISVSLLLQLFVIYSPLLHPALGPIGGVFTTTPIGLIDWLEIVAVSGAIFAAMLLKEKIFGSEI